MERKRRKHWGTRQSARHDDSRLDSRHIAAVMLTIASLLHCTHAHSLLGQTDRMAFQLLSHMPSSCINHCLIAAPTASTTHKLQQCLDMHAGHPSLSWITVRHSRDSHAAPMPSRLMLAALQCSPLSTMTGCADCNTDLMRCMYLMQALLQTWGWQGSQHQRPPPFPDQTWGWSSPPDAM